MQVKFGEFNAMQNEDIQQINPDEIAVDDNYEPLFCVESDLSLEEAQQKVDAVNKEYFPVVPSPTELVTIQLENEQRIFSAAK